MAIFALGASAGAAAAAASPADWMYEPTTFTEIRLTLPSSQYELLEDANYDEYVEGFFSLAETSGTPGSVGPFSAPIKVGVKLKGSIGSRRNINEKAALKIKFDEFVDDQTFEGLEKMTLNNMVQDPSFIHETLAYKAFHDMGVYAPHTGFSYLWVNGKSYGLHLNIETQDKVALEKVFGPFQNPPQHLYEGEYQADVSSAPWHGTSEPRWKKLEVDEGKKTSKGDLETLLAAVEGGGGTFSERVAKYADLTEMSRMWLVEKYIEHWDGYSGSAVNEYQPNNYYLYSDAAGRFQILPWGTDQTWETASESRHDVQFGGPGGALFEDCKGDPACWSMFESAGSEALTKLSAVGLGTTARCSAAAVMPWREYENTAPEGKKPPQSVAVTKEKQQKVREFIASRPAELASFLGVAAPPKTSDASACPPLRPVGGFPKPPPPTVPVAPATGTPNQFESITPPPTPRLEFGRRQMLPGAIVLNLQASGPGKVQVEGSFGGGSRRATACRGRAEAGVAGSLQVRCRLTKALRRRLQERATYVSVTATLVTAPGVAQARTISLRLAKR
jgi:hypothetical protein